MEKVIQHEKYGVVVYNENFWTGKPKIFIGGTLLNKISKRTFEYIDGENKIIVIVKGNMLKGVQLVIGSDVITVQDPPKWYEYVLSVFIFVFNLVWGNIPACVAIIPIVGGALGGFFSALFAMLNLLFMRKTEKLWLKLLLFVIFFALSILVCFLLALIVLAIINSTAVLS